MIERSGLAIDLTECIAIRDITFSYGDRTIFNHASFHFDHKSCCAIVGESGSGKTTLIKLIMKYFDEYEGDIYFGGKNLRDLTEHDIFEYTAHVAQNPYIFDASLKDNITMFDETFDAKKYEEVIQRTNLTALKEHVKDRPLGSFGDTISGGEKQRINLARALYRDTKVLIFDEPTTGLDPQNRDMIYAIIFSLEDTTRIVITHD